MSVGHVGGCTKGYSIGCPAGVRPGTPPLFLCVVLYVCSPPQLGGARGSRRTAPRPLALQPFHAFRSRLFARHGRSLLLATSEGQGLSPLHPDEPPNDCSIAEFHRSGRFVLADGASKLAPPRALCVVLFVVCVHDQSSKTMFLAVPSDVHRPRLSGRCRRSVVAMFLARFRGNRLLSVSPPLLWKD